MDALEFKALNKELKENISKEIKQREVQEQILLRQCRMADMGVCLILLHINGGNHSCTSTLFYLI